LENYYLILNGKITINRWAYKYQNISVDDENISSDKKNQPEPMDKKINSPINKKSMWTSTNTWSGPNLNIVQSK
jgi:hypothetical protein